MEGLQLKYFTLNPAKPDAFGVASRAAMQAYAKSIEEHNPVLATDLRQWAQRCEPQPSSALPLIGQGWEQQGGTYAGIVRGAAGEPDYHLIVAEVDDGERKWLAAIEWAKGLWLNGFRDFTLPLRKEQAVMFGNVPELFEKTWYWSSEQYADAAEFAWFQTFYNGFQDYYRKDYELRARAVRRVPIR